MTTKRKVRRPNGWRRAWITKVDREMICIQSGSFPIKEAKRLIRWLTQAVAWLEQEEWK